MRTYSVVVDMSAKAADLELAADGREQVAMRVHLLCLRAERDKTTWSSNEHARVGRLAGEAGELRRVATALRNRSAAA